MCGGNPQVSVLDVVVASRTRSQRMVSSLSGTSVKKMSMREGREEKPSFPEISEEASRRLWRCRGFEAGTATALLLSEVSELAGVTDRDKCPIQADAASIAATPRLQTEYKIGALFQLPARLFLGMCEVGGFYLLTCALDVNIPMPH